MLSPLRLPYPLTLKVAGCDGVMNAWYDDEVITVCYELLAAILQNAEAQDLPAGVTKADTILGPALDVFLHETGHAVFNMLQIPVLGREEDAANFSAYVMLRLSKPEARRMILGSAYHRSMQTSAAGAAPSRNAFSDEHSLPAQRAFNVLCIAYGADKELFADIVEKEFLPKGRAEGCGVEYDDLTFAMTKLIGPHIVEGRGQTISSGLDQNRQCPTRAAEPLGCSGKKSTQLSPWKEAAYLIPSSERRKPPARASLRQTKLPLKPRPERFCRFR